MIIIDLTKKTSMRFCRSSSQTGITGRCAERWIQLYRTQKMLSTGAITLRRALGREEPNAWMIA